MFVKTCSLHWFWEAWAGRRSPDFRTVGVVAACPVLSVTEDGATEDALTLPCPGSALRALVCELCHPPRCEVRAAVTPSDRPETAPPAFGRSDVLNRPGGLARARARACSPAGPRLASSHRILLSSGRGRFTSKFSAALILFARLCFHIDVTLICLIIQTAIKQANKTNVSRIARRSRVNLRNVDAVTVLSLANVIGMPHLSISLSLLSLN